VYPQCSHFIFFVGFFVGFVFCMFYVSDIGSVISLWLEKVLRFVLLEERVLFAFSVYVHSVYVIMVFESVFY
jgi:hypothetical protein